MQNGGTARIGFKESGLMSIKNGMLITMVNGTIGNRMGLRMFGFAWAAQVLNFISHRFIFHPGLPLQLISLAYQFHRGYFLSFVE
jgi:hypothetical protein